MRGVPRHTQPIRETRNLVCACLMGGNNLHSLEHKPVPQCGPVFKCGSINPLSVTTKPQKLPRSKLFLLSIFIILVQN